MPRVAPALLPVVVLALVACGGAGGPDAAEVAVRDSAGIAIIEHPAAAVDAVPIARPGEASLSIGGEEADEDHDATFLQRGYLLADGVIGYNVRESRMIRYDGSGVMVASYGRRGDGPDEFQAMIPFRTTGDSLLLVDIARSTHRVLRPDLSTSPSVSFGDGPIFQQQPFGVTPDGALLAVYRSFDPSNRETSGPPRRNARPIVRLAPGAASWDTVMTIRGELVYPMTFTEGGQSYPGERMVTMGAFPHHAVWGDALVTVDNGDRTIELRDFDGTLRRSIRFAVPLRPLTQEIRDSALARDARQMEEFQAPEAIKAQFLEQSRNQVFADSVAPYDRIFVSRDEGLWLRLNETPADSTTVWHGHDKDGRLAVRLELPRGWALLDVDGVRILVRRSDDLGLGYLEIRRMMVPGREGDGGEALP